MNITDRMLMVANNKKITQKQIGIHLGIEQPTIAKWKSRGTNPPAELIEPIAELLGVSVQWLMTGKESEISEEEQKILQLYKNLSSKGKERLEEYAELLSQKYKNM